MPDETITVRQRTSIPFREIARVAFSKYPRRAILCLALFVGQAFLYNAITFDLGTILTTYFKVASGAVPYFLVIFAAGNFLGPLLLGRLFDTVGRKIMVTFCYLGSAIGGAVLAVFLLGGSPSEWIFIALVGVTFFLASAGASAAYLTVSEIFPMETRALAIAFFYAVGTAVGGITGPLLFGHLIDSGNRGELAVGFVIGAVVMALGGIAELFFGVKAEGQSLESIAEPLTATDASADAASPQPGAPARATRASRRGCGATGRASAPRPRTRRGCRSRPTRATSASSTARSTRSSASSRSGARSTARRSPRRARAHLGSGPLPRRAARGDRRGQGAPDGRRFEAFVRRIFFFFFFFFFFLKKKYATFARSALVDDPLVEPGAALGETHQE